MRSLRILLATDLSPDPGQALAAVASLAASDPQVECVLLHALQPGREAIDLERVEAACWELGDQLRAHGARVSETVVIRIATPEDLISDTVRELGAALVVIGLGLRAQGSSARLGSTLRGAVRAAAYPVLLLGPGCVQIPLNGLEELGRLDEAGSRQHLRVCELGDDPPLVRLTRVKQAIAKTGPADALLLKLEAREKAFGAGAPTHGSVPSTVPSRGSPRPGAVA